MFNAKLAHHALVNNVCRGRWWWIHKGGVASLLLQSIIINSIRALRVGSSRYGRHGHRRVHVIEDCDIAAGRITRTIAIWTG